MHEADVSSRTELPSTILSPELLAVLASAADRIIPPDSEGAGGAEGGSAAYIVRHLEAEGNLVSFRSDYLTFLQALSAGDFALLDTAAQDTVLARFERSESGPERRFFRSFAEHVQEGYYTNSDNWPSIGFAVTG